MKNKLTLEEIIHISKYVNVYKRNHCQERAGTLPWVADLGKTGYFIASRLLDHNMQFLRVFI